MAKEVAETIREALKQEHSAKVNKMDVEGLKIEKGIGRPGYSQVWNDCIDHLNEAGYLNAWQDIEKLQHHEEIRIWRHNDVWGCKMIWKNGKYSRTFHSVETLGEAIKLALKMNTTTQPTKNKD